MNELVINGGKRLLGAVEVKGAKNSVLPLFAAAILTEEEVEINNVPDLSDVRNMLKILSSLGAETDFQKGTVKIRAKVLSGNEIPGDLAKELRSSVFLLGSVLSRVGSAKVAYPGGCDIGLRPIDIHVKALRDLGVTVYEEKGFVLCNNRFSRSAEVFLDYPSVGATENALLASVFLPGLTTIHNAACEPELIDLQKFLNLMGANVFGAGTSVIKIFGVDKLHGAKMSAMPDRIVAGTYAIAAAITGGEVELVHAEEKDMRALLSKLAKSSCNISVNGDIIKITANGSPVAVDKITTRPHPGFPTDLQAPMTALLSVSTGTSVLCENVFENRFRHVGELQKMGAKIIVDGRTAIVSGVDRLHGAVVSAQDLRGGAALVLAGLNADGQTVVKNVEYIDRGYERIEEVLRYLGADIRRT